MSGVRPKMRPQEFGPYELLERISAGGMAEVFRATHRPTGREVALKRILPHVAQDEEFLRMFEDEARIVRRLEHPHIARCLDFGKIDDEWFIAFEFVDGKNLQTIFDRACASGTRPPLWFVLHAASRIAEGLAYAHARRDGEGSPVSIVHRDVSLQNIVVSITGDVKLIDFGIAKATGRVSRTQAGSIKGKFGYMSPEQASGQITDHRSDIFSLGVCTWELLTLHRLYAADNELRALERLRFGDVEPPSLFGLQVEAKVGEELDRIVLKALAKEPDERYRAARDFFRDLNQLAEGTNLVAAREQIAQYMRRMFPDFLEENGKRGANQDSQSSELREVRDDTKRHADPEQRESAAWVMENRAMAAENKGGSDLDIFEGLGKKSAPAPQSSDLGAAPPAPPVPPPAIPQRPGEIKRTLIGVAPSSSSNIAAAPVYVPVAAASAPAVVPPPLPSSAQAFPSSAQTQNGSNGVNGHGSTGTTSGTSGSAASPASSRPLAVPSVPPPLGSAAALSTKSAPPPPPPPGRGSLPNVVPPPSPSKAGPVTGSITAVSLAPSTAFAPPAPPTPAPPSAPTRPVDKPLEGLQMDWDDEDEATHIFDKDVESSRSGEMPKAPVAAGSREIGKQSQPTPVVAKPIPAPLPTMPGLQPPPPPPAPPTARPSAPPPPPSIGSALGNNRPTVPTPPPRTTTNGSARVMPPPPPQQQVTAPMPLPPRPASISPGSIPPTSLPASVPPPMPMPHFAQTGPYPIASAASRMEQTAVVRPSSKATWLWAAVALFGLAAVGIGAVFVLMPRTGNLAINVTDTAGASVSRVDIFVDGAKRCDTSPCLVELGAGHHVIKTLKDEQPMQKDVVVEARKDMTIDFSLPAVTSKAGTGLKVSGSQVGTKLFVDGKEMGPLPQELRDLTPGDHTIKISGGDRYAPIEKKVIVAKDEMLDLGAQQLKVVKGKATIKLSTPGAKVYLVSGTDRRELPIPPNVDAQAVDIDTSKSWSLEATKLGFNDFKQQITFDDGQAEKAFDVQLEAKGSAPSTAAATRSTPPAAPAAPAPASQPAAAKEPAPAPAAATGEAFLNINSIPPSNCFIDGKALGATPKIKFQVSPGTHSVKFVNAELGVTKTISVTVGAGETKGAVAKLN